MAARHILEGEWSGYTSAQRRIVHRETITEKRRARYEGRGGLHGVRFTDGTMLHLCVRPVRRGERVDPIIGYISLIAEAERAEGCVFQVRPLSEAEGR